MDRYLLLFGGHYGLYNLEKNILGYDKHLRVFCINKNCPKV